MNYIDRLYGSFELDEPLILELLQTPALRRLDGVLQHGITGLIGITKPISRLEHSLGAMLIVRSLAGSLEEQVAALLHDVSHTAFSHVIDYVFDQSTTQSYHDEVKEEYVSQTTIPALLTRHGFSNWQKILDESNYPILEQPAPALCADRLDYFFRDALDLHLATQKEIAAARKQLILHNGRIVTTNIQTAQWLAHTYLAADNKSWSNFREVGLYYLTAEAIKLGLQKELISHSDIWLTDQELWHKLTHSADPQLQELIPLISPQTEFIADPDNPDFISSSKLRTIDPDILQDNQLFPLSELDPSYKEMRQQYLTAKSGNWSYRIIPPLH